jgi:hypothetical protein
MKYLLWSMGLVGIVFVNTASADALSNSLSNMMGEKDSSGMVNLSALNLDAKPPKPVVRRVPKTRSKNAVVGTINSHKIIKKVADKYLSDRTKGKVKNFDVLSKVQRKRLLKEMAFPIVLLDAAEKDMTPTDREAILARIWMQKEARTLRVTVAEVREVYEGLKKQAIDSNDTRPIPPFKSIQDKLHIQMVEKLMMDKLMKDMKIEIVETNTTAKSKGNK